jgi:hypothetical protein
MRRTRLYAIFLCLAFAFMAGQQASLQHGLGHAIDKTAPSVHCIDCGLAAQLSGPAGDTLPVVARLAASLPPGEAAQSQVERRHVAVFLSRGPPQLL